jgi:regulator of cell morphogenesis and NO signaling
MQTTTERTVREIAIENPASVTVFESLGIDYCCGGRRPLSEACASAHVEMERVLRLLEAARRGSQATETGDWSGKPLSDLIGHIVGKHHGFVRRELPRIAPLLAKVAAKHGATHPETTEIEALFAAVGQELSAHLLKEEQVLFPYIVNLEQAGVSGPRPAACFGSVERPIATMMAEHENAGALLARIRELSHGYTAPADACPTFLAVYHGLEEFERDLHRHIHLENNILFPRAIELEQAR